MRTLRLTWLAAILLLLLPACRRHPSGPGGGGNSGAQFQPTEPRLLSTGSPTKDEDPSVVRARDGRMVVAWFSDRGGNADIYVASTRDGTTWSAPARVTTSPDGDFNPSLIQDDQGTFHLVWFRWNALFRGNIWYNSSPDGVTWSPAAEVPVTTGADVDDWVPTLAQAPDGTLVVVFVSDKRDANPANELYLSTRRPGQAAWDPPVALVAVNSAAEHDHLPFAARTGDHVTLVWVRHDTRQILPWLNPKSDLFYSTSSDGRAWSPAARLTSESGDVVNLFPALFESHAGEWSFLWLSTRHGTPRAFEDPVANAAKYPSGVTESTLPPSGYSYKVAATPTAGVYLGVWVQGPEGSQDIYYRFYRR
ncbi:MAG TPA: sialidase family protein [Longimicrobium sp.]